MWNSIQALVVFCLFLHILESNDSVGKKEDFRPFSKVGLPTYKLSVASVGRIFLNFGKGPIQSDKPTTTIFWFSQLWGDFGSENEICIFDNMILSVASFFS